MSNRRESLGLVSVSSINSLRNNISSEYVTKKDNVTVMPVRLYYLGDKYPDVYLTLREAQCIYQLIQGATFAVTADRLNLSPRTVEYYVKNMRSKLHVANKIELVALVMRTDFLKIIGPEVRLD